MKKADVTVGIITYNRPQIIGECLNTVLHQTVRPKKIIIIDSSENDKTEKIMKNFKPDEKIIYKHFNKRVFQPKARNDILKMCKTKIMAYVDDDAIAKPCWLENIVKGYSYENVVGVTGPCINVDKNFKPIEKIIIDCKNLNYFTLGGDIRCESRRWVPKKPVRTKVMSGGNMSFNTRELRRVGGFDEFYSRAAAFREETDPQIALIQKGYDFMYMPQALVYHVRGIPGGIRGDEDRNYFYWCGKNHRYLADKYFPKWKSRLSWIFWSVSPPCLWLTMILALIRRDRTYLDWIRGLWT